ncbi:MAG TPA: ChrR family anti-sigma-E factor [Frateuria sp.]|uniref:ChrR family anti-sigma-E factor n=1 Tax=Frateuria sp. TaxID=2211372 RepID=UPI002DE392B2|nr:ChrR family anti-sigma-E factor [Frateuria sp.]
MTPAHHLDPATVMAYAAGALSEAMAVVVAAHLTGCDHCRAQVRDAERIGGVLVEQQQPDEVGAGRREQLRAEMIERLDQSPVFPAQAAQAPAPTVSDPDPLPAPLHPYFGRSFGTLKWRWMAPGVHCIRSPVAGGGQLFMLRIAPGKSMPLHGHGRSELTQVLRGAYNDVLGHFGPGDVADLDSEVMHQPVTAVGSPCICVAALDAPLRFPGWFARRLQPLVGL